MAMLMTRRFGSHMQAKLMKIKKMKKKETAEVFPMLLLPISSSELTRRQQQYQILEIEI